MSIILNSHLVRRKRDKIENDDPWEMMLNKRRKFHESKQSPVNRKSYNTLKILDLLQ